MYFSSLQHWTYDSQKKLLKRNSRFHFLRPSFDFTHGYETPFHEEVNEISFRLLLLGPRVERSYTIAFYHFYSIIAGVSYFLLLASPANRVCCVCTHQHIAPFSSRCFSNDDDKEEEKKLSISVLRSWSVFLYSLLPSLMHVGDFLVHFFPFRIQSSDVTSSAMTMSKKKWNEADQQQCVRGYYDLCWHLHSNVFLHFSFALVCLEFFHLWHHRHSRFRFSSR